MNDFVQDFITGLASWRKWHLLGTQSIRSRYARSKLGQFWPSLSYFITVLSLGVVYAYLWHSPVKDFLPYLAVSHVFWSLISGCVVEGSKTFIDYESLIRTEHHPRSMFVMGLLTRQITYFLHNAVVLIPLLIIFPQNFGWVILLAIPGLLLVILNAYWMILVTGLVCTRFRDFPNVVSSVMQIMFFVTPVVWEAHRLTSPTVKFLLAELNPFASLLAVVRDPILGMAPSVAQYSVVSALLIVGYALAVFLFGKSHRRLAYWL